MGKSGRGGAKKEQGKGKYFTPPAADLRHRGTESTENWEGDNE